VAQLEIEVERLQSGTASTTPSCCAGSTPAAIPSCASISRRAPLWIRRRYQLSGESTFTVSVDHRRHVTVVMPSDHSLVVRGEQVVDIRDFGVVSPTVLMLRIYPDVVVGLQIEAELDEQAQPAGQ